MEDQFTAIQRQYEAGVTKPAALKPIKDIKSLLQRVNARMNIAPNERKKKRYGAMITGLSIYYAKLTQKFFKAKVKTIDLITCEQAFENNVQVAIIVNLCHKNLDSFLLFAKKKFLKFLVRVKLKCIKIYGI